MKLKKDIKIKLFSLLEDIEEMHKHRNNEKEKYGGILEEENKDFFYDLCVKHTQINILEWVLKK